MKSLIFIALSFLLLVSCYEDKGNYDYLDVPEIEIKSFDYQGKNLGDTIKIEPEFNVDIPEDASYITYKWSVDGETRPNDPNWNSRNFFWIADKLIPKGYIVLEVRDERLDAVYTQRASVNISGEFNSVFSWVILSEGEDRAAKLSFFKTLEGEYSSDYSEYFIKKIKVYEDLYPSVNDNKTLGQGPLSLREHFNEGEGNDVGNYWIFTESGAVDCYGESFLKDIDMSQTFRGGLPAGTIIQDGVFMQWVDVIYDQNGRIYTRIKADDELFNSDYFLQEPVSYKGEVLEQCYTVLGRYTSWGGRYTLVVDKKHSRLLAILDGESKGWELPLANAGEILEMPANVADAPEGYVPLHDFSDYEIVDIKYIKIPSGWSGVPGYVILFKEKSSGKLILQEFALETGRDDVLGNYLILSNIKVHDMSGLPTIPSQMVATPNDNSQYVFFAIDNVLWCYDRETAYLMKYKEFDAKITAMEGESDFRNKHIAVGLENGEFFVLNAIRAKNQPDEKRIISQLPEGVRLGKIVKIHYKIGSKGSWS